MKKVSIVYLVAGLSSRFGGKIKSFVEVGSKGETLIEYSLKQAIDSGFEKLIFVVSRHTEKPFKERFKESYKGIPVYYALQDYDPKKRDKPWGTVDAICSAKKLISESFVICNGDDIYGKKTFERLIEHLKKGGENAGIGYKLKDVLPKKGNVNRGIFQEENGYLKNIIEIFDINRENFREKGLREDSLCNMNIFALTPRTLEELSKKLEKFKIQNKDNQTIECLLPIELGKLISEGKIKMRLYYTPEKWFGITNPGDEKIVKNQLSIL